MHIYDTLFNACMQSMCGGHIRKSCRHTKYINTDRACEREALYTHTHTHTHTHTPRAM